MYLPDGDAKRISSSGYANDYSGGKLKITCAYLPPGNRDLLMLLIRRGILLFR